MRLEREARQTIDSMLEASGWKIQNYAEQETDASLGVAVREYILQDDQRADYLLFINGVAVGIVEAKPEGTTISGPLQQAERYYASLPDTLPTLQGCPFLYASTVIQDFKQFINEQRDDLPALQILCERPGAQGTLTENSLKELEEALYQHSVSLSRESLWMAYEKRSSERVRGTTTRQSDLISLVRFATEIYRILEPFSDIVKRKFNEWLEGKDFDSEHREWLEMIQEHIATSLDIQMEDFGLTPFARHGGISRVCHLFGDELEDLLTDLTEKLVS